jgi:hypothetical protein
MKCPDSVFLLQHRMSVLDSFLKASGQEKSFSTSISAELLFSGMVYLTPILSDSSAFSALRKPLSAIRKASFRPDSAIAALMAVTSRMFPP